MYKTQNNAINTKLWTILLIFFNQVFEIRYVFYAYKLSVWTNYISNAQ